MFNINPDQIASLVRGALKFGGGIAICAGQVDPHLGQAVSALVTSFGTIAASAGFIWSYYKHKGTV